MKKKLLIIGTVLLLLIAAVVAVILLFCNKKVTISFETDGGTIVNAIKIKKGETITLPVVEKEGYILEGWYLGDSRVDDTTTYDKDVTLKARWNEDIKTFTVTFDSDGGSEVASMKVECGKELKLPSNPTKDGYTFVSWVDRNERPILDQALLTCDDITLKANWMKN